MLNQYQSLKLNLLHLGYDKLDNKWNFDNVISPFSRMYLITKGQANVYHNNEKFTLLPGFMYLIPSYTYSSYKCDSYHEQYYISFYEEMGSNLSIYNFVKFKYKVKATKLDSIFFDRLLELNPNRSLSNNNPTYYEQHHKLKSNQEKNQKLTPGSFVETQGILKILLSKFIDKNQMISKNTSLNLDKVLTYISEHLNEDIKVSDLAAFCNLNKDHFSRVFKKSYNILPSNYIQVKRIERSILLLSTTKLSVKEVAYYVGFETYSSFVRSFKNHLNKTPSDFRKEKQSL